MVTIQKYEGNPIAFNFTEDHRLINLSQMAKPFGREPANFLRTKTAKAFIKQLSQSVNLQTGRLVIRQNGGKNPGTWGHELLALKFAGWLSPAFELWMMERIRELLTAQPSAGTQLQMPILLSDHTEYQEAQRLCVKLSAVAGSTAALSIRLGVSNATLSCLKNGKFERVATPMLARLLTAMRHLDRHGFAYDNETVELLMLVKNDRVRSRLFAKLKTAAL